MIKLTLALLTCTFFFPTAFAESADESGMTNAKLGELLSRIDAEVEGEAGSWTIEFEGVPAQIVTDAAADRMRIMIAITEVADLERDHLYRLLQANFESALDARYAVAHGYIWSTFIHPLSTLDEKELISAVAQTYNAAFTYGTTFSSGLFNYGGGDNSGGDNVFDKILDKGYPS